MSREPRIWRYEVTDVGGSMEGRIKPGEITLDRWHGHTHTYNVFDFAARDITGWWTVKLLGEADEETAERVRAGWRERKAA